MRVSHINRALGLSTALPAGSSVTRKETTISTVSMTPARNTDYPMTARSGAGVSVAVERTPTPCSPALLLPSAQTLRRPEGGQDTGLSPGLAAAAGARRSTVCLPLHYSVSNKVSKPWTKSTGHRTTDELQEVHGRCILLN